MKGKQNHKNRHDSLTHRSTQRSASFDKATKKSVLNSIVYESSRNSLCSPRESKVGQKFEHYIQYVAGGKIPSDSNNNRYSFNRPKTSTPRRMSVCLMEQGRRSAAKQNGSKDIIKQGCKTPREKSKPLFVKGSNIVKTHKSKEQIKKKKQASQKHACSKRNSVKPENSKRNSKADDKLQQKQKKLIEKLFAGIQFHRQLGRGAHALVKCGVDFTKQRKIAVKIYEKKELSSQELKSIERQVEILGSLDHPGIIKLYEIIETLKTINLVLEYGGGNSLEQYIRNRPSGRLEQNEAKGIFKYILSAISYIHRKGVAHRDIKTENILLNKYLQVKLIDFGFSYKQSNEQKSNTFCGTPTYMAPQIVMKKPHCPILADRWALGILLYTVLHGHCPFKAQNQKDLFKRILQHNIQFEGHIGEQAKMIITSLLSVTPEERPSPEKLLQHPWLSHK